MIRCVRIWTAEDGNSSFEEGQIDLSGGARGDVLSAIVSSSSISFRETKAGGAFEWHDAPVRQFVLTLSGTLEFKTRRGDRFMIHPGDVLLAEDTAGSGHSWRLVDDEPWRRACHPCARDQSPVHSRSRLTANRRAHMSEPATDVVLIGAGIMSATLGTLFKELEPSLSISILEVLSDCALESSGSWNNAGTGHAANCELNYTPSGQMAASTSQGRWKSTQSSTSRVSSGPISSGRAPSPTRGTSSIPVHT